MTQTVTIEKQVWESTLHRSMVLEAENAQLKELLKECREEIASVEWDSVANDRNQMKLLTKIDEVLK
jgi:hypothetical protein